MTSRLLAFGQLANAQDFLGRKLVKYQYTPNAASKKTITAKIESIFSTRLGDTQLQWAKLAGDTVIHIWPKDMDSKILAGNTFTFKGIRRLSYNFREKKAK